MCYQKAKRSPVLPLESNFPFPKKAHLPLSYKYFQIELAVFMETIGPGNLSEHARITRLGAMWQKNHAAFAKVPSLRDFNQHCGRKLLCGTT